MSRASPMSAFESTLIGMSAHSRSAAIAIGIYGE
jgi:hypothetical protein